MARSQQRSTDIDNGSESAFVRSLDRVSWLTERALNFLMVSALVCMMALVFTNVVLRYGFNSGISVSVELSRFLFVWVTFLGTIICLVRNEHLTVYTLRDRLSPVAQTWLQRLVTLIMLGCCLMLLKGSYTQTVLNWNNHLPISGIPEGLFYLAGLVGGSLMSLILIFRLLVPGYLKKSLTSGDDSA